MKHISPLLDAVFSREAMRSKAGNRELKCTDSGVHGLSCPDRFSHEVVGSQDGEPVKTNAIPLHELELLADILATIFASMREAEISVALTSHHEDAT
jgi:hypothetical protein